MDKNIVKKSVGLLLLFVLVFSTAATASSSLSQPNLLYLPLISKGSAPLAIEERIEALEAIQARLEELAGEHIAEKNQILAEFIRQRPEFDDAGVSTDYSVWGRFRDGRLLIVANNRSPYFLTDDNSGLHQPGTISHLPTIPATLIEKIENSGIPGAVEPAGNSNYVTNLLPVSNKAYSFNSLGTCYRPAADGVAGWLEEKGYEVTRGNATVDNLKGVQKAGLFYLDAHGGRVGHSFAFSTKTKVTPEQEALYEEDVEVGRLVYMVVSHDLKDEGGACTSERFYGITAQFVSHYMTFKEHGLAFLNACSSDNDEMKAAFKTSGVSLYMGWTDLVPDLAAQKVGLYFFDRMLGMNAFEPESPPQRPFDYRSVREDIKKKGYHTLRFCTHPNLPGNAWDKCPEENRKEPWLIFSQLQDHFGVLVPTVEWIEPDYQNLREHPLVLEIEGIFDPTLSGWEVLLDDTELEILEIWGNRIVAALPPSGPGSAGNLVVRVRDASGEHVRSGNSVPLTRWQGQLQQTRDYSVAIAPGILATLHCDLTFIGDVHAYRAEAGGAPIEPTWARIFSMPDSNCQWEMSGTGTQYGNVYTVSASGTVLWAHYRDDPSPPYLLFNGFAQMPERTIEAWMGVEVGPVEVTVTYPGGSQFIYDYPLSFTTADLDFVLDAAFNILAGSQETYMESIHVLTQWDVMNSQFAPNPTATCASTHCVGVGP
jgi:hypothetical protein